jgi:hypothetical protein
MRLSSNVRVVLAALALAGVSAPRIAEACGGTFCDSGPMPMPVNQTGENIAFVMLQGMVEAHIQIQYNGEAPKFSWILPVQQVPEVEVGSEALFDKLLQATVPTYMVTTQRDFCGDTAVTSGFSASSTGSTGVGTGGSGGSGPGGPPVVVFQKTVGAFDVTALMGGTTTEVIKWLTDNQYQVPTNASALLDGYVANHFVFVAVKLTGGKGVDQIHPLVVRYPGTNPCVPIKLTSVAAENNMGIRTFFLGTRRVAPKNYKHIELNLVKFDWFNAATAYNDFVSQAIDSPVAMGKAWVTEYAGPTSIVGSQPIAMRSWDPVPFQTTAPVAVVQLLQNQGLAQCFADMCTYNHVLVLPLLRQYLPAPASLVFNGMTITDPALVETYFYSHLASYQDKIDMAKWNGPNFAMDFSKRIIEPAKHADTLLSGTYPYLTRMFTTMSPSEMDLDPEFLERDGLDSVPAINLTATQRITCSNRAGMVLPDGHDVALVSQGTWPTFSLRMPWVKKIDEIQPATIVHLVDNTATIESELAAWNNAQSWPPPSTTGPTTTTGPGGTGPGAGGAGGAGGADGSGPVAVDHGSCGCRAVGSTTSTAASPWAAAALLGLLARFARRRVRS